jgi:hypothetical protein
MKYPDGKIHKTDEGELKLAIGVKEGRVIIDFGKDLSWVGFDKQTLRVVIDSLEAKYNEI